MTTSAKAPTETTLTTATAARASSFLRHQLWVWPLIAAALLAFEGIWVRARMEGAIRGEVAHNLATIRDANAEALRAWATSMRSQVELLAEEQQTRTLIQGLLERETQPGWSRATLLAAPEFSQLRARLKPAEEGHGFAGYAVLDTNFVVVAAGQDQFVGVKSPRGYSERLAACFAGQVIVTPPFSTLAMSADHAEGTPSDVPIMFAAAPVRSDNGRAIAVLALRILPERDFTRILGTARSGATGETYAFGRGGLLLSESRFDEELKRLGLIQDSPHAHSLLTLELRDPLVDLRRGRRLPKYRTELPFTKPVTEALARRDGVDLQGFRDYRGVPVVAAWTWLPEFQMGLVAQMDEAEALAPVRIVRRGFWFLFGLMAAGSAVVFLLMRLARRAALKATRLGQYELVEEIGGGGFGTVFRARHALMRRPVAVKVLTPAASELAIARFEREVQLTCQLSHPNTIVLYDYGRTPEGLFYYAMEYLEGLSLAELIEQYGPQPEGRVIHILTQVCASLAEAHSQGLVHRDIKPQNIFLTCRGGIPDFVKVLDFGLVKARETTPQLELTAANATLGTPLYMSPEAVERPDTVTALSDVYSLGAVGYELLTGGTVFAAPTVGGILIQQLRMQPEKPSQRLKRPVSADLEDILMRCLSKIPSARPANAETLEEALRNCAASGSWPRSAAEAWWKRRPATLGPKAAAA